MSDNNGDEIVMAAGSGEYDLISREETRRDLDKVVSDMSRSCRVALTAVR